MNLGEIKSQFTGLMNRRDLSANTTLIDTFVSQGIMRVQRELRVPATEKSIVFTVDEATYAGLVIPEDFIELKEMYPTANLSDKSLKKTTLDKARAMSEDVGTPLVYARQGGVWLLGPTPEDGATIRVDYWAETEALTLDADENILTSIAWDLIVYAALCAASDYYVDKRREGFEMRYTQILTTLHDQAEQDDLGGDAVVQPALIWPSDDN
jgi:hypothetical protein